MTFIDTPTAEYVVLVDAQDQPIGIKEKLAAHEAGLLHRAFSVCILRKAGESWQLLLQQRAQGKYHSSGLWTNTCCSHPRPDEAIMQAATRRLQEEMGITAPLTACGHFIYKAALDNGLTEHELDHVFIGIVAGDIAVPYNTDEVMAYRWISLPELQQQLQQQPQNYTAWLKQVLTQMELSSCLNS